MQLSQTLEVDCLSPSLECCGDVACCRDHRQVALNVESKPLLGESADIGRMFEFRRSNLAIKHEEIRVVAEKHRK